MRRSGQRALKELQKLGNGKQARQETVAACRDERVAGGADPRRFGKGLKADLSGLWRYRAGDFRILGRIVDGGLLVLVVAVGHRRDIYGWRASGPAFPDNQPFPSAIRESNIGRARLRRME